ncbi:MAG TPA: nucleoside deaminase [Streptosporangiaceae bacterium]|nr:nucleoside deaminase [Streptosporangiaceae bacterium]
MTNASSSLPALSDPERACLALAWEALLAGTMPIGAVVVDATGTIIASGRNAVYGTADPPLISGSALAHAEVNALLWLPTGKEHASYQLVTSLEPCLLCTGALRMAGLGAVTYLGADPRHGGLWALTSPMYAARQEVKVAGPRADQVGLLAAGLTFAYHRRRSATSAFGLACQERRPDIAAAGTALAAAGLFAMAEREMSWAAAEPVLLAAV